ncbi:MAG: complex I subunit 1 family protein [Candidatus Micrarchaeaceae archaeon]|jgi:NADH-quinone oxidoreductase subunit H|nr:NADH-quinone oxidoreductase subunit H [Candidatus Micrarchaeota archaeon]HII10115.1 NADH-quinone oxidoreductase subunit H [Candidatus Micrarchaeota archaeon]
MIIGSPAIASYFNFIYGLLSGHVGAPFLWPLAFIIAFIVFAVLLAILFSLFAYVFGWVERKIIGHAQSRHGPTYVGPFGFLQNLADLVKLISKEHMVPDRADKPLYQMILPAIVALFVLILAFIPFTNAFVGIDSSIGLFAVFVLISFSPLLLFLAGWTSGNKFGSISAQRSVMVMISYEVPMFLVIIAVAMLSNGYSLVSVVGAQSSYWFALLMPIGFVIFFIVMLAELERPPFDLREADSELVAGWLTDASAPYYALALMLDYVRMFVGALLIALLFFGGWLGPSVILPFAWLIAKVLLITVFIVIIRATSVRMRIDNVLKLGWIYLTPLAMLNLLVTFIVFVR